MLELITGSSQLALDVALSKKREIKNEVPKVRNWNAHELDHRQEALEEVPRMLELQLQDPTKIRRNKMTLESPTNWRESAIDRLTKMELEQETKRDNAEEEI